MHNCVENSLQWELIVNIWKQGILIITIIIIKKSLILLYYYYRDGWLGIHYAARWGDMSMLKTYVKAGANIDGKTNSKETALHKCGRWDRKEAALYLLSLGANPAYKNGDGNKASDMTADPEMKFLLDNYEEYLKLEEERRKEKFEFQQKEKDEKNALNLNTPTQVSSRLYGATDMNLLSMNINDILNSSPPKTKSNKTFSSSNNSVSSKGSKSIGSSSRKSSPRGY